MIGNITSKDVASSGVDGLDSLYPALVQCFAIILCGYIAGRFGIVSNTEAKGINVICGYFALPSLIFMALVQIDLDTVNWNFLFAILISKVIIYFSVMGIHVIVRKPTDLASAGVYGMFCTQSNDFAIGYPIISALYKHSHPDYAAYLYLVAPINLAMLNPISFTLLEMKKRRIAQNENQLTDANSTRGQRKWKNVLAVLKLIRNIIFNPVIFMTLLGIVCNFIFKNKVPIYIANILNTLGSAFPASALFLLGLRMVGQRERLKDRMSLITPALLIIAKLMVLPLVIRETVNILNSGITANSTSELSTYGFLYGTLPSAPFAFVIATQYGIEEDLIAISMVACTFVSAPIMFISAKMITLTKTDPSQYIHSLNAFTFDISIIGLIASVWVLIVYILTKKITKIPHKFTVCLVISQVMSCLGSILWNTLDLKDGFPGQLQFALFTVGVYSSRIWTAILAMTLLFLQARSMCHILFKLQPLFFITGFGLPVLLSILLLFLDKTDNVPIDQRNPNFVYGIYQAIIAVSLLILCFTVTLGCLILHQRQSKESDEYWTIAQERAYTINDTDYDSESEPHREGRNQSVITSTPSRNNTTYASTSETYLVECSVNETCNNTNNGTNSCTNNGINNGTNKCQSASGKCNPLATISESTEDSPSVNVLDIEDLFATPNLKLPLIKRNNRHTRYEEESDDYGDTVSLIKTDDDDDILLAPETSLASIDEETLHQRTRSLGDEYADPNPYPSQSRPSVVCPSRLGCLEQSHCGGIMLQYEARIDDDLEFIEEDAANHDPQILRHAILLILLLCSMFIGLAISTWTLVMEKMSGIYIELSFLDAALNFGQSLMVFAVFGTDTKQVILPVLKFWRKLWYGANVLNLPMESELSLETKHTCEQFANHHLDKCKEDIAKNKRWRLKVYRKVFSGSTLVDWLIEVGLARDRTGAVNYARHLIEGKTLRHINAVYHFYDGNLLYTFN